MKTYSCSDCGNELVVIKYCRDCRQPAYHQCGNCRKIVDDHVHGNENILESKLVDVW